MKKISRRNFLLASGAVTIGAALAACGGSSSTSTASSAPASSAASAAPAAQGKVLNIWCWNDEFQSRFNDYYPEVKEIAADKSTTTLKDGTVVKWTINANENNNYQNKLDEALLSQDSAADDDKIDIFLIEADYALKYANGDVALSIQDLGITDDDMSQMYQYTKDVATDTKTGELKGVSWQATPGLFLYNTKIAEDVLGTSDPEKVQEAVKDWDTFTATAQKMADKGYKMVSGFDDTYRCFSNNMSSPWVTDNKITIDPQIKAWADQTKEYTDKGYNNKTSLWDDAWAAGQKIDGGVFGYFFSTWGIPFTLLPNTVDEEIKADGSNAKEGNGGYGLWKACSGPQAYYWGGTWICGAIDSDNQDIVADIMKVMTCNKDVAKAITEGEQDYTNNKAAIKELIDGGYTNAFLGGQDHLALLTEAADKISLENKLSAYDQGCNEKFQGAMKDYFLGTVDSYEAALENFKKNITDLYGNLTCDF